MSEVYTSENQATEGGGSKFAGVRVNTGAAGEFIAVAGDNLVTEQGKRVASMRVNVPAIGTTEDAQVLPAATGSLIGRVRAVQTLINERIALLGRAAAAASKPVALSTEDLAALGATAEVAPATDTATSGLNGRLQRIAQRLTSLIGLVPASLGRKAATAALAVVFSTEDLAAIDAVAAKLPPLLTAVPTVTNLTLTIANTEYTHVLPAQCQSVTVRARTPVDLHYAFVIGKVAVPTAPYMTLPGGNAYIKERIRLASGTMYLACGVGGTVVEIETWSS